MANTLLVVHVDIAVKPEAVPDFLAAGPRDVLVPESGAEAAREVLLQSRLAPTAGAPLRPNPLKLAAGVVLGGAGAALIAWLLQN